MMIYLAPVLLLLFLLFLHSGVRRSCHSCELFIMLRPQKKSKITHKWTDKSRVILLILKNFHTRKETTAIWNFIFRDRLAAEGFRGGIPPTRLDGQHQEMKNGGKGFHFYTQVNGASRDEIRALFPAYCTEIKAAVRRLDLAGSHKDHRSGSTAGSVSAHRRQGRVQVMVPSLQQGHDEHEGQTTSTSVRPNLQHFAYQPSPYFDIALGNAGIEDQLAPVPSSQDTASSRFTGTAPAKSSRRPLILFRATPEIASFRSRRYQDAKKVVPPPPEFGTQKFKDIAWPHLERDRSYRSPFISLAQNPHNALRRVELARSEEIDKKMFFTIFSFAELTQDGINQFGFETGPYLVRSLFTSEEISDLPDGYKGAGEFLQYGAILCEPIAILDSYQAVSLAKALRRFKHGDCDALLRIHWDLQPVPLEWKTTVAKLLLTRYCGRLRVPEEGTLAFDSLMRVIYEGTPDSLDAYESQRSTDLLNRSDEDDREYISSDIDVDTSIESYSEAAISSSQAVAIAQDAIDACTSIQETAQKAEDLKSSWVVVDRLNNIASVTRRALQPSLPIHRDNATPWWSPSPASDVQQRESQQETDVSNECAVIGNDWDLLNDTDYDFAEGLGSAFARKISRVATNGFNPDEPISTIEETPTPDGFC